MVDTNYIGTVIDNKYRLDQQIGQGGMGTVYAATQLMVDRKVAIKLLHAQFSQHQELHARFEVEAKAIARLNHPNCITLFDFGFSDEIGACYTVVEFINGDPLDSRIARGVTIEQAIAIVKQIASALDHAHHHGILHRDLKPENIMIAEMTDGTEVVKVLDFGIARIMKGDDPPTGDTQRITKAGEVFGTPPYMSPEQARSERELTPACDFYSLGIIFYELLEGRLPFIADTPLDVIIKHLQELPPPLKRDSLPEGLQSIVYWLLEKDPQLRPQSGRELCERLDNLNAQKHTSTIRAFSSSGSAYDETLEGHAPRAMLHTETFQGMPPQSPDASDADSGSHFSKSINDSSSHQVSRPTETVHVSLSDTDYAIMSAEKRRNAALIGLLTAGVIFVLAGALFYYSSSPPQLNNSPSVVVSDSVGKEHPLDEELNDIVAAMPKDDNQEGDGEADVPDAAVEKSIDEQPAVRSPVVAEEKTDTRSHQTSSAKRDVRKAVKPASSSPDGSTSRSTVQPKDASRSRQESSRETKRERPAKLDLGASNKPNGETEETPRRPVRLGL